MINRSVVRIPLVPTVFKEYFDMFFKVVRKNISQKINRNINSCRMRVPVPSCSRSMISGQNLTGAFTTWLTDSLVRLRVRQVIIRSHCYMVMLRDDDPRCRLRKMKIISSDSIALLRRLSMTFDNNPTHYQHILPQTRKEACVNVLRTSESVKPLRERMFGLIGTITSVGRVHKL